MTQKPWVLGIFAVALIAILSYVALTPMELALPTLIPSDLPRQLAPLSSFDNLPQTVGDFLWGNKALDLIAQAFVLLASAICCLALLKTDGDSN